MKDWILKDWTMKYWAVKDCTVKDWTMKDWAMKDWTMKDWTIKDWTMKDWIMAAGFCPLPYVGVNISMKLYFDTPECTIDKNGLRKTNLPIRRGLL